MDYQQQLKDRIEKKLNQLGENVSKLENVIEVSKAEGISYPSRAHFTIESYNLMRDAITLMNFYNEQFGDDENIKEIEKILSRNIDITSNDLKKIFKVIRNIKPKLTE